MVKRNRVCKKPAAAPDNNWAAGYNKNTDPTAIKCLLCDGDKSKLFSSWKSFAHHLRKSHGKCRYDLNDTYIAAQLQHETTPITAFEVQSVSLDADDNRFVCRLCTPPTSFPKRSAHKHMTRNHRLELVEFDITADDVSKWIVCKEGSRQRNASACNISLRTALECYNANADCAAHADDDATRCSSDVECTPPDNTNRNAANISGCASRVDESERTIGSPGTRLLTQLHEKANRALENGDMREFDYMFEKATRLMELKAKSTPSVCATPLVSQSGSSTDVVTRDSDMMTEIRKLQRGGDDVPVPKVQIGQHALDWDGAKKSRTTWPFPATAQFHINGLEEYMLKNKRVLPDTFKDSTQQGINYFFQLLAVGSDKYSDVGVFQALQDQHIMGDIIKLKIFDPSFSWTRKMLSSLSHGIDFMLLRCEDCNFGPARRSLKLLQANYITPTKKACLEFRKEAKQSRKELDYERLKGYLPVELAKRTLAESMVDLYRVWRISKGCEFISPFLQRIASVTLTWQIVIPGTFARSGELENLTEGEVKKASANGRKFVLITKHKTAKKHGALGRHFSDAMWTASDYYGELPPLQGSTFTDEDRPFLRPAQPHVKKAGVYGFLKIGGRVNCPKHTFPRTNLQRKWITSAVRKDDNVETCKKWVAEYNAHILTTAEDNYNLSPPEDQAIKGKTMSSAFFGKFVEWPTDDMPLEETLAEALKHLQDKYGRHDECPDDAESSSSDDESENEIGVDDAAGLDNAEVKGARKKINKRPASAAPVVRKLRRRPNVIRRKVDTTDAINRARFDGAEQELLARLDDAGLDHREPERSNDDDDDDVDRRHVIRSSREHDKKLKSIEIAVAHASGVAEDAQTATHTPVELADTGGSAPSQQQVSAETAHVTSAYQADNAAEDDRDDYDAGATDDACAEHKTPLVVSNPSSSDAPIIQFDDNTPLIALAKPCKNRTPITSDVHTSSGVVADTGCSASSKHVSATIAMTIKKLSEADAPNLRIVTPFQVEWMLNQNYRFMNGWTPAPLHVFKEWLEAEGRIEGGVVAAGSINIKTMISVVKRAELRMNSGAV